VRTLVRWSEIVFASISLLLWSAMPFPPTARVMWNWVLLTLSVILGIAFFIWLKRESRAAWACAGIWAALTVTDLLIGIIRVGFPDVARSSPAVVISFLLVYAWGLTQAVVLVTVVGWFFQQRSVRAVDA
jgi:hypothetical protein